jgi:predicted nuclease with RNAse H fold
MALVLGVDLSGPANPRDTAAAWFEVDGEALGFAGGRLGAGDPELCELVARLAGSAPLWVGLDAPLSYQPGGGDRPGDTALRRLVVARGLHPGSVMAPTLTRMAYLTLRGIALARAIERVAPGARIVEVHPGAAMALRGAPASALRRMKRSPRARRALAGWLARQGLRGLPDGRASDHELAARACALATWRWSQGRPAWLAPAAPPLHPYDFAC